MSYVIKDKIVHSYMGKDDWYGQQSRAQRFTRKKAHSIASRLEDAVVVRLISRKKTT